MKRIFSAFLSLVMLIGITAGIDLSAYANTYYESENNDNSRTADYVELNSTIYGVCSDMYDCDWYRFTLPSSGKVNIRFNHDKGDNGGCWWITVQNSNGKILVDKFVDDYDNGYSFSTLGLSSGTYYIFVGLGSNYAARGLEYSVTVNYSITAPSSLNVSSRSTSALKLSWSGVSGASGYQLQHKSGNSWKTNTTTSSTSYTVKGLGAGSTYQFRVRAYKKINGKSYYSSWRYLTACAKPATVKLSKVSAQSGHKLKASWQKASGSASGYQIYWAKDKKFKKVVAKTNVSGQKKTSYTGKNFTKGRKYYVKIRAYKTVDGKKYYGSWSNIKSVKAK